MIHIYYGNGKGKTSAALGLSLRFAGSGGKVTFVQFLKDSSSSEICLLKNIENMTVRCFQETVDGFFFSMNEEEKCLLCKETKNGFDFAMHVLASQACDMLVLDEIGGSIENGLVKEDDVLEMIKKFGEKTEIVLTGRCFRQKILECADYVSEICEIKHPYTKGIKPRKGIEY